MVWLLTALLFSPAWGQRLRGEWVDEAEARIEQIRKTPVRVILLDSRGNPAAGAAVRLEQTRHALEVGVVVDRLEILDDFNASTQEAVGLRSVNGVSIGPLGRWEIDGGELGGEGSDLARVFREADRRGWRVRWGGPGGGVISDDPAFNPDWAASLRGHDLWNAVDTRLQTVLRGGGDRLADIELLANPLDHQMLRDRIGEGTTRRLFETARARQPRAALWLRFSDAISGDRGARIAAAVVAARETFVDFDGIVIEQSFQGPVVQPPLARTLARLERLEVPVVFEVAVEGETPLAEAVAVEAVLRTLVGSPVVRGVVFQHPEKGGPLRGEAGEVVERLFNGLWRTDDEVLTDELGNARGRVFAGAYRITATLPNGETAEAEAWLPLADEEHTVVVQATPKEQP